MLAPDPIQIAIELPDRSVYLHMAACGGRDQVVRELAQNGWLAYERPLPKLISILVSSQKCSFLDIGANTGYYSLLAAVLGSDEVRAYEPVPQICEVIKCNIIHTFNTCSQPICIFPLALSNQDGEAQLFVPDGSHGLIETSSSLNSYFKKHHAYSLQITRSTLDSHVRNVPLRNNNLVVIKIDVESHEPEVLQGASLLIQERRPIIIAEILPGGTDEWFQEWAIKYDYEHYSLDPIKGAKKRKQIKASSKYRDHLFAPKERAVEHLLRELA